jgi:hypothetical protein
VDRYFEKMSWCVINRILSGIVPGHVHIKERTTTTTEFKASCLTSVLAMLSVRSAYGASLGRSKAARYEYGQMGIRPLSQTLPRS